MEKAGIVAFAFGTPHTISSNQRIARIASQMAHALDIPVYTQFDIHCEPGVEVEYTSEPGDPPPTLRIARGAVQWAKQREFRELWIVAAKPHLWRCIRDLTYAVRKARVEIKVLVCKEIEQSTESDWFCPDSTQARTRSWENWYGRERILKLMPIFLYKYLAS